MKIYKITAMWCLSCLYMNGIFNEVIKNYDIEVVPYDFDLDQEKIKDLNIGDILPVYILYKDNQEIRRSVGEKSKEQLKKFIEGDSY